MEYRYKPSGVCSREFVFDIKDDIIQKLDVVGGCSGNLQGISKLLVGMNINDVVERIKGLKCGMKSTSCPDQIALALQKFLESEQN